MNRFFILIIIFLTSCAVKHTTQPIIQGDLTLIPSKFENLEGWERENHSEAKELYCLKNKDEICKINYQTSKSFFEDNFTPYLISKRDDSEGLFTGYYEISLKGSRTKQGKYQYPIYSVPMDKYLKLTRKEIDEQGLEGYEILWLDNPVDVFFLHIQGSGLVNMDDGSIVRVGFAGRNNYKYKSIGKWLIDNNIMSRSEMSAEGIKRWLHTHPKRMYEVLHKNPSYIFFRETGAGGAIGSLGIELTPKRSMAVDRDYIKLGSMLWLDTTLPKGEKFQRIMFAEDTGSAIKGVVRGDIFFGYGDEAEYLASYMKNKGKYYLLVRK